MATVLNIETATTNCSVSIGKDGLVIDLLEDNNHAYSHAERLHVYINTILQRNNLTGKDIDAVAVSKGPGSYTGLRIGVSAAKGLCFAWDVPLISIPTLTSLAHQVTHKEGFIVSMLDARRMEVYAAVFDSEKKQLQDTQAVILTPNSYQNYLDKANVCFVGSGVSKFKEICNHPNAIFLEGAMPSAKQMVSLSNAAYKISNTEDVAYFEPYYLKEFFTT